MNAFVKRFARNKGALVGVTIVFIVLLVALLAGTVFPESPWNASGDPLLDPLQDAAHWLGTDMLGRDIASGLAHGARVSLLVGLVSTAVATLIGISVGAVAGYYGGRIDDLLMRLTEFFQTIPTLAMAVVLVAIFQPTLTSIISAIAIVSWPPVAGWCAVNSCRCARASSCRRRWSSARVRRASSSRRSCRTPCRRSS